MRPPDEAKRVHVYGDFNQRSVDFCPRLATGACFLEGGNDALCPFHFYARRRQQAVAEGGVSGRNGALCLVAKPACPEGVGLQTLFILPGVGTIDGGKAGGKIVHPFALQRIDTHGGDGTNSPPDVVEIASDLACPRPLVGWCEILQFLDQDVSAGVRRTYQRAFVGAGNEEP